MTPIRCPLPASIKPSTTWAKRSRPLTCTRYLHFLFFLLNPFIRPPITVCLHFIKNSKARCFAAFLICFANACFSSACFILSLPVKAVHSSFPVSSFPVPCQPVFSAQPIAGIAFHNALHLIIRQSVFLLSDLPLQRPRLQLPGTIQDQ